MGAGLILLVRPEISRLAPCPHRLTVRSAGDVVDKSGTILAGSQGQDVLAVESREGKSVSRLFQVKEVTSPVDRSFTANNAQADTCLKPAANLWFQPSPSHWAV